MSVSESRETEIHPTAIVHPKAELGAGTSVGPFAIVEEGVQTGRHCVIRSHAVVTGRTTLGDEVQIYPFAVIGSEPQHLKYRGEPTRVEIGHRVILRESVTVHRGTEIGTGVTRIGDDSLIMAYAHVAHDCVVGRKTILANSVQLAGHTEIGERVTIGGLSAIAQFCRVGDYCYVGGGSILRKDLPPFLLGKGADFAVQGVNAVGLSRNGFSESAVQRLKSLYKIFYLQGLTVSRAIERIVTDLGEEGEVKAFLDFVRGSKVGFIR